LRERGFLASRPAFRWFHSPHWPGDPAPVLFCLRLIPLFLWDTLMRMPPDMECESDSAVLQLYLPLTGFL